MLTAERGLAPMHAPAGQPRLVGLDCVTCFSLGLTIAGWGLFWASALGLLTGLPTWLAALAFFLGLALIPLRTEGGVVAPEGGR